MAAAYLNRLAAPTLARGVSAGTSPGPRVHPEVVAVMREEGIELEGVAPQRLTLELASGADLLVTMGCGDECPHVPGLAREDWPLSDPRGRPLEEVRVIRDGIRDRVLRLIATLESGPSA
jgi:arsenate reductase